MESNGQLTFDDDPITIKYKEGFQRILKGEFNEALDCFDEVFEKSPGYTGVEDSIKAVKFWQSRIKRLTKLPKGEERADFLLGEWKNFEDFRVKIKINYKDILDTLKKYVYKESARNLTINFQQSEIPNIEILVKLGEVFIEMQEYEKAVETLEYARLFRRSDALIFSFLAEGYYFLNDEPRSKVLFREAFSIDAQAIKLDKLKTPFIVMLKEQVAQAGFSGMEIAEWIPVFAVLENIFVVKRELSKEELAKLESDITELEYEYHKTNFNKRVLEPRLLNKYFWIIDFYLIEGTNKDKIIEYDNKIMELNPEVHKKFKELITETEGK